MNIIELAKQAGFLSLDKKNILIRAGYYDKEIEKLCKLAAAHERRECAKLCAEVGAWALVHEIEARGET
jgi:hypothetical protein